MGGLGEVSTTNQIAGLQLLLGQQRLGSLGEGHQRLVSFCWGQFLCFSRVTFKNNISHFGKENLHLSNILQQNMKFKVSFQ